MHLALVHDHVTDTPDAKDVLSQAALVEDALFALGHTSVRIPCTLNLLELREHIRNAGADLVFNLVESLDGKGSLIHLFPFLLDAMGVPYTGTPAEALMLTSNKVLAKQKLNEAGILTAPYVTSTVPFSSGETLWIIKSVWEHASIGLSEESIVPKADVASKLSPLCGKYFAEEFIDGREFNVSLLAGTDGPQVLPPAEIRFDGFPPDKAKIVDYKAKWEEETFEYRHTLRSFDFPPADAPLLEVLKTIALSCWHVFGLRGWARVDFRVDTAGSPYVLEVNANPCLSPDAGFAAATAQAGISPSEAIARIIGDTGRQSAVGSRGKGVPSQRSAVDSKEMCFREEITEADREKVRDLVAATGFFHGDEVNVAVELVEERLLKGNDSGYHFVLSDRDGRLAGYACFGPIPCTQSSFDLYWIAVSPEFQGKGLGRHLMAESEKRIQELGGTRIYVDTSSRAQYAATRAFYERCGYSPEVILADFYAEGDGKALYCKVLS